MDVKELSSSDKTIVDDKFIELLVNSPYFHVTSKSSKRILSNPKWIRCLIAKKQIAAINFVIGEAENLIYDNELMNILFDYGYQINEKSHPLIKNSSVWLKESIERGRINAVNYVLGDALKSFSDDDFIKLVFNLGYEINDNSSIVIRSNPKWFLKSLDLYKVNAINFIAGDALNCLRDENVLNMLFDGKYIKKTFEKGYTLNSQSPLLLKSHPVWLKNALEITGYQGKRELIEDISVLNDPEVIASIIDAGYEICFTSPKFIKQSDKWFKIALEKGQVDSIKYVSENVKSVLDNNYIESIISDEKYISKVFEKGYILNFTSPNNIKINENWIKYAIKYGQSDAINFAIGTAMKLLDNDELIEAVLSINYDIENAPMHIKSNPKWMKKAVSFGIVKAVDNLIGNSLVLVNNDEFIRSAFSAGYKVSRFSPEYIKSNPKWIKFSLANNQYNALTFANGKCFEDYDIICEIINCVCNEFITCDFLGLVNEKLLIQIISNQSEEIKLNLCLRIMDYVFENIKGSLYQQSLNLFLLKIVYKHLMNQSLKDRFEIILFNIGNELLKKFHDSKEVYYYLNNVIKGNILSPINLKYINNLKALKFVNYFNTDLLSVCSSELLLGVADEVFIKGNKKQIKNILNLLREKFNSQAGNAEIIAINLYLTLDYSRIMDLLSGKYGSISEVALTNIFGNIVSSNVLFEKDGSSYKPQINQQLINIIFGSSYNTPNTIIRNYLGGFREKMGEIDNLKSKVKSDLSLTTLQRDDKIHQLDLQFKKYYDNVLSFVVNASQLFNEWDIIEEEFIENNVVNSKMKNKLSIIKLNELIRTLNKKRSLLKYDINDEMLLNSDVFDYLLNDTTFIGTNSIDDSFARCLVLSSRLDNKDAKKFPFITIQKNGYTIRTYHPQDRKILSAGYRTGCCFRPCGIGDNSGNDNSLLNYCISTEYGGGVEIVDENNNTIMFSPILRNGNVVLLHSIETKWPPLPKFCFELLNDFANRMIMEADQNGDDISFVVITNMHNLDDKYTFGELPYDKKFNVYDENDEYLGMYNNLIFQHMIIGKKAKKTVKDIYYGKVDISYICNEFDNKNIIQLSKNELEYIVKLNELNIIYSEIYNERMNALKSGDEQLAYHLLQLLKDNKNKYLSIYSKLVSNGKDINVFKQYNRAILFINRINGNKEFNSNELIYAKYTDKWYIAKMLDGKVIVNCCQNGQSELEKELDHDILIGNISEYEYFGRKPMSIIKNKT